MAKTRTAKPRSRTKSRDGSPKAKSRPVVAAAKKLLTFDVFNRWSGAVQFTAQIDCAENECPSIKLGLAIKWAFKNGARLDGARLDGARLDGARLDGARLDGASLDGASLDGASLVGARLVGARLVGARLVGARLDGARLDGARLVGARLVGARLRSLSGTPHKLAAGASLFLLGQPNGWYALTFVTENGEQRVHVGCRDFTIAEGRKYWAGKESRREVMAALDYAEAVGRARGWDQIKSVKAAA